MKREKIEAEDRSLYEIAEAEYPGVLQRLKTPQREKLRGLIVSSSMERQEIQFHSGPLPSPDQLAAYEKILPGSTDRILTMAEKQGEHRRALETKAVTEQLKQSGRGQLFGLIVALAAMGCGLTAILHGHVWAGSALGTGSVAGLVSVFVYGKRKQDKDLEQKKPPQG